MNLVNTVGMISYQSGCARVRCRHFLRKGTSAYRALKRLDFTPRHTIKDRLDRDRLIVERMNGRGYFVVFPNYFRPEDRVEEVRQPVASHVVAARVVHGRLLRRTGRLSGVSGATAC